MQITSLVDYLLTYAELAALVVWLSVAYRCLKGATLSQAIRVESNDSGLPEKKVAQWPILLQLGYCLLAWPVGAYRSFRNILL